MKFNSMTLSWIPLLILLSLSFCLGCDDGSGDDDDDDSAVDGDTQEDGDEDWNPDADGDDSDDCSGYGYGDDCPDTGELDCDQDPCIFGECIDNGTPHCECQAGYAGTLCDRCAEGYVVRGLQCVKLDACATFVCAFGECILINNQPVCNCDEGYTGDACDRCAQGYHESEFRCVSDEEAR